MTFVPYPIWSTDEIVNRRTGERSEVFCTPGGSITLMREEISIAIAEMEREGVADWLIAPLRRLLES